MLSKRQKIIGTVILLAFCVFIGITGIVRQKILLNNHVFGNAIITDLSAGGRGNGAGIWVGYTTIINGKKYKSSSNFSTSDFWVYDGNNYFLGKSFPIIYDPKYPSISRILILQKDFKELNIPYPDSLHWVLKYIHD